jgi:quercetin dioxygenase-like cupin family protein
VGHRRPDGPPGTTGIEGQVIDSGPSGSIAELAFARHARIAPHTNPNWTWFVVIEGGGWVGVGDERSRVLAGEAVAWPPDVLHAAWTEGTQMRALVVEFAAPATLLAAPEAGTTPQLPSRPVTRGEGRLAERRGPARRRPEDDVQGEPL